MNMLKQYWAKLNERDQMALVIGGLVLALLLFYTLIYSPLVTNVNEERAMLIEQNETLKWIESVEKYSLQSSSKKKNVSNSKLLGIINQQLNQAEFQPFPFQLQQTSNMDIQLSFNKVSFKIFIVWLWELSKQYQTQIHQLSLEKLDTPGLVKVTLTLRTGNQ